MDKLKELYTLEPVRKIQSDENSLNMKFVHNNNKKLLNAKCACARARYVYVDVEAPDGAECIVLMTAPGIKSERYKEKVRELFKSHYRLHRNFLRSSEVV